MFFDYNELYFSNVDEDLFLVNKLENAEGEDPAEWLKSELRKKPAKVILDGEIVGEAKDYDLETDILKIVRYDKPIPVITRDEWLKITGLE